MLQTEPAMDMSRQEMVRDIGRGIDGELDPNSTPRSLHSLSLTGTSLQLCTMWLIIGELLGCAYLHALNLHHHQPKAIFRKLGLPTWLHFPFRDGWACRGGGSRSQEANSFVAKDGFLRVGIFRVSALKVSSFVFDFPGKCGEVLKIKGRTHESIA